MAQRNARNTWVYDALMNDRPDLVRSRIWISSLGGSRLVG
jgi:hypothetical protein